MIDIKDIELSSNPEDIKVILCQIQREVETMIQDTNATLLLHDGKIAECCKYLKDNLSNSIRHLLDDMKYSGELEKIISETIMCSINKRVIFIDTLTILKDSILQKGDVIRTLGYHQINDGGSSLYKIRKQEVNDITNEDSLILLKNGLVAEMIIEKEINVKQYGAKGDGITDDSEAFKKAIEENNNIFVPAGRYLINQNIIVSKENSEIHLYGTGKDCEIFTNKDIEIFTFNKGTLTIEKLKIAHYTNDVRKNVGISFNNLSKLMVNEIQIVGTDTYKNSIFGLYVNNVTLSTIKNCIFNNSRLDLTTWDIKIDKCWFWAVSQNYAIRTIGSCGNITITNSDFVPPFADKTNYIFTNEVKDSSWNDMLKQGAIIIGDGSYAVNNVKIDSCYIDGNPARSGRGIVINKYCFNIVINNVSVNLINDNFLTIDSAYNINVTNCNLSNYGLDSMDKVKFVDIYKKGVQPTENINISNNIINANNVVSNELQPVICVNENAKVSIVDYNTFLGNSSKNTWTTEIQLTGYDGTVEMAHNKSTGKGAHVFKSVGKFNVASGSSGANVFLTDALKYPYTLRPERIHISAINKMLPKFRLQPIPDNNTQFYMAFEEPLTSDVEFFYTAEM